MKTYKTSVKSAALVAGAAAIPTAVLFISGILSQGFISSAIAGSKTDDIDVTATVSDNCVFTGATADLAFLEYDPAGVNYTAQDTATTEFTVRCTKGASVTFKLDNGDNVNSAQRRMKLDAGNLLNYNLFSDAGNSVAWNATTYPAAVVSAGPSTPITKTIYGVIPAGQDVSAGSYTDNVVITAEF